MKIRTKILLLSGLIFATLAMMSSMLFYVAADVDREFSTIRDKDVSQLPDDPVVLKDILTSSLELSVELESSLVLMAGDLAWVSLFMLIPIGLIFFIARRIDT